MRESYQYTQKEIKEDYLNFMDNCKNNFDDVVSDLMEEKFKSYEEVKNQFCKFFNQEELEHRFNNKADKSDIKQVNLDRASK